MTPEQRDLLDRYLQPGRNIWLPLAGPQQQAYVSLADIVFYGGQAGGGKTDEAIGLALTSHRQSIIFRREYKQLRGIIERLTRILRSRSGFNENAGIWRLPEGRTLELGAVQRVGDEQKWMGQPHDLIVFDEVTHFDEAQVRFLTGWLRTDVPGQRCRVLMTGNPPTDVEGEWVIDFFAPWLDDDYTGVRAMPGELRWFITVEENGRDCDREVPGPDPVMIDGRLLYPQSRTFIPASVTDNPFYMATGYDRQLDSLPAELRMRLRDGKFIRTGMGSPFQVIMGEWVDAAFERWRNRARPNEPLSALGVDVARGGKDETVIAPRRGDWYDEMLAYPGAETPDGPSAAAVVVAAMGSDEPAIGVDVVGYGSSAYDHLAGLNAIALNGAETTDEKDRHGRFGFANKRALWYWRFREALDPEFGATLALPPDPQLRKELLMTRWKLTSRGIQVESKEDIVARLKRSPDRADAAVYAWAVDGESGGPRVRSL